MPMPRLEVLVGCIASGKSTYARRRAREGALVVAHDDLTQMLHAEYRYEEDLRIFYRTMEEDLVAGVLTWGRDVIIDRTHLTHESRVRWVTFAREYTRLSYPGEKRIHVVAVAFPFRRSALEHAHARFDLDPRGRPLEDWVWVAEHHWAQALAEPLHAHDEGFDEFIEIPDLYGRIRPNPALAAQEAR